MGSQDRGRRSKQLLAYFAGIFDGEGSVGAYYKNGTCKLNCSIAMDDPTAIMLFWREYPECALRRMHRVGGRDYFVFALNHYKADRFLEDITPYCLVKWPQVKVARSFLAHRRRDHQGRRIGECQECRRFCEKLKALKTPDPQGVNSVNTLDLHGLREYRAEREVLDDDLRAVTAKWAELREGVETKHRASKPVEATSSPEKDIVQTA